MATMHLIRDDIERRCGDREMVERLLELDGKRVVELGCGAAVNTRALAAAGRDRRVLAYEVDQTQHQLNLATPPQPNVEFRYGSAAAIDCADGSVDVVMMLKSLHHVPREALPQALREIHRVLIVGGLFYVCEPLFAGAFNDILKLFHDEQRVRAAAFGALQDAVASGLFDLAAEEFYLTPSSFRDFAEFEQRVIKVTHTSHCLTPALLADVARSFATHCGADGARFYNPMRVDVLVKPAA